MYKILEIGFDVIEKKINKKHLYYVWKDLRLK